MKSVMKAAATLLLVVMLGGCAVGKTRGWVLAGVTGANYTEDNIVDVSIQATDGRRLGIGIAHVNEFSRGGTSGDECCARIPGVGQTIQVVWHVEGRERGAQRKSYSRKVIVMGATLGRNMEHSYLIVRFFRGQDLEAELFPSEDFRPENPRIDELFSGRRVMRQKGE